jgi:hypothetical protein
MAYTLEEGEAEEEEEEYDDEKQLKFNWESFLSYLDP